MEENWKIPLYKIYTDEEDLNLISRIIKRGTKWAIGPEIEEFEQAIKNYVGCDYCLTLNSGTSSLHATYLAYGLHDQEVIIPSFTFISTANSVLFVGCKPIFADIEKETLGLDPSSVLNLINKSTRAIIPVDVGGLPCKILDIKKIAEDQNLLLIEDAAESLGASIDNQKIGSIADTTIFSFCGNKVLTTGEGGAITTNSKEIFEKIKLIRSHGRVDTLSYFDNPNSSQYVDVGYNWRMSSITAGLGLSQLSKLDKIIKMRQNNANYVSQGLSKFPEIITPKPQHNSTHIYQMYTIRLPNKKIRDELQQFLLKKKIFCKIYFDPIHLTQFYSKKFATGSGILPTTESISQQVLTLPMYPNMTNDEKNYVIDSIAEYIETRV